MQLLQNSPYRQLSMIRYIPQNMNFIVYMISDVSLAFLFFSPRMYLVVEFSEVGKDGKPATTVAIIPNIWLIDGTHCYWCPSNVDRAVRLHDSPKTDWPQYEMKVLGSAGENYIYHRLKMIVMNKLRIDNISILIHDSVLKYELLGY